MRKKKNNRSYKFTEKKKSVRGMIACVGAVISLLILAGMLIQAVTSAGNGGAFLGSAGVVALFVGVASFIEAVQAVQEKDTFRSIPYTAVGLSAGCDSAVVSTLHVRNFVIKEKTKWITNG